MVTDGHSTQVYTFPDRVIFRPQRATHKHRECRYISHRGVFIVALDYHESKVSQNHPTGTIPFRSHKPCMSSYIIHSLTLCLIIHH
jgi:hypothetical protein